MLIRLKLLAVYSYIYCMFKVIGDIHNTKT